MRTILASIARMYLWRFLPGGKRARFYSINAMRARHPTWFHEDLERLFGLLATHAIRPRVAERISFDEVADAHRRIEAGGLEGNSSCARTSHRDPMACRFSAAGRPLRQGRARALTAAQPVYYFSDSDGFQDTG